MPIKYELCNETYEQDLFSIRDQSEKLYLSGKKLRRVQMVSRDRSEQEIRKYLQGFSNALMLLDHQMAYLAKAGVGPSTHNFICSWTVRHNTQRTPAFLMATFRVSMALKSETTSEGAELTGISTGYEISENLYKQRNASARIIQKEWVKSRPSTERRAKKQRRT